MTVSVVAGVVAVLFSILGTTLVAGQILGSVKTRLALHAEELVRHAAGIADKGKRIEALGRELSELRGELRGRAERGAE